MEQINDDGEEEEKKNDDDLSSFNVTCQAPFDRIIS